MAGKGTRVSLDSLEIIFLFTNTADCIGACILNEAYYPTRILGMPRAPTQWGGDTPVGQHQSTVYTHKMNPQ